MGKHLSYANMFEDVADTIFKVARRQDAREHIKITMQKNREANAMKVAMDFHRFAAETPAPDTYNPDEWELGPWE